MSSGNLALSTVGLVAAVACIPFQTVTYNQNKVNFLLACFFSCQMVLVKLALVWQVFRLYCLLDGNTKRVRVNYEKFWTISPNQLSTSGELEAAHCRKVNQWSLLLLHRLTITIILREKSTANKVVIHCNHIEEKVVTHWNHIDNKVVTHCNHTDNKVVTRKRPHPVPRGKLGHLGLCRTTSHLQKYNPGTASSSINSKQNKN